MAIQLRRGNEADLDISQLRPGEMAVCLDTGKMIVKLNGNNYLTLSDTPELRAIVDGKAAASHSHDAAVASSGGSGGSPGFITGADKEKLDGQGVVLFEPTGGAAFETGTTITLSTSIAGYRWVEVEITNGIRSRVRVVNGATPAFTMFVPTLAFGAPISLVLRVITMSISGNTLTVDSSAFYNLRYNGSAETVSTNSNWNAGKIFQVVGYK